MTSSRILIIEDDAHLATILAKRMEREGFEVSVAANGEDGLRLLKKDQPNLIILDLVMPRLDGFETMRRITSDPETSGVPVLVMSNLSQREDIERVRESGAAAYIIKAHTALHDVVAKVRDILGAA